MQKHLKRHKQVDFAARHIVFVNVVSPVAPLQLAAEMGLNKNLAMLLEQRRLVAIAMSKGINLETYAPVFDNYTEQIKELLGL